MSPNNIQVTVVVPAYRRTAVLRAAILSLFAQDLPAARYEVIVVDSSPEEDNCRMMEELAPSAPCAFRWFHKKPEGPGPSRNLGAAEARADIIAFMDSDCQAAPGWLRGGLAAFSEGIGIVQGRTLPDPAGKLGVFRHYVRVEAETPIYETANVFYRKQAFMESGGFPADLTPRASAPMGGEDVVVAWSVKRKGWLTRFAPEALVHHEVMPMPVWKWIFIRNFFIWPALVGRFPELRSILYGAYFLDRPQAMFTLGAAATLAAPFFHWALLALWIPYCLVRGLEPSATLRGPLRPVRLPAYLLRDTSTFCLLVAGSIKYRCLVL